MFPVGNMMARVLIGCESSGHTRDAFIRAGHDAISCDLLASDAPGPHYQGDLRDLLVPGTFDFALFHPPCTYLSSSGLHWNHKVPGRAAKTEEALEFVRLLLAAKTVIPRIALENPVGCIGTRIRPYDQMIQPYQFGHDASKRTALWLHNLPPLAIDPALRVPGRIVTYKGKQYERWANQTDSGQNKLAPSEDRWKIRSETYQGISDSMAAQWGALL